MAALIREQTGAEALVVTGWELLHKVRAEDRERILNQLNGRTTADIDRDLELISAALARLASRPERRSGRDRRLRRDRRSGRGVLRIGRRAPLGPGPSLRTRQTRMQCGAKEPAHGRLLPQHRREPERSRNENRKGLEQAQCG